MYWGCPLALFGAVYIDHSVEEAMPVYMSVTVPAQLFPVGAEGGFSAMWKYWTLLHPAALRAKSERAIRPGSREVGF
jgi:hypothetical protein